MIKEYFVISIVALVLVGSVAWMLYSTEMKRLDIQLAASTRPLESHIEMVTNHPSDDQQTINKQLTKKGIW